MYRLDCHFNNYGWGKIGADSEVARLFADGHPSFKIDAAKPYSEMWMGTHPIGPARIRDTQMKLSAHLALSQGRQLANNNDGKTQEVHLPFIMKVMSIKKTLSIQVHPTKEQAVRLHARDPLNYPDEHHKPELAYALTQFELLCGFRPAKELLENLEAFPSLRRLFGTADCDTLRNLINAGFEQTHLKVRVALAAMFKRMIVTEGDELKELLFDTFTALDRGVRGSLREDTVAVIRNMAQDFPGDVGVFAPFYLNHIVMQPGECVYYAAEELHAYLSGECVECVGCSNNTIRAACTPKFKDIDALCEVLNYRMTDPEEYMVAAESLPGPHAHVDEYAPDCRDFQLHRIQIEESREEEHALPALECDSITVILAGKGVFSMRNEADQEIKRLAIARGEVVYIASGVTVKVLECSEPIDAYRTFSFEEGPDHSNRTVIHNPSAATTGVYVKKNIPSCQEKLIRAQKKKVFNVESEMDGMC